MEASIGDDFVALSEGIGVTLLKPTIQASN